jgi:hypothetical protein
MSGVPVGGAPVSFQFGGGVGSLASGGATTDANGHASVHFIAGSMTGQGTLIATADLAPEVTVTIVVTENPKADLIVEVSSSARIAVANAGASIYIAPAGRAPTCAELNAAATPPAPTLFAMYSAVPGSQTFSNQMTGSVVTVLATGTSTQGLVVARGCTEGAQLAGGRTTTVHVTLDQLPTDFSGNYDVLLNMNLGATLPPPYDTIIDTIVGVLSDPAGWAVYQVMSVVDARLSTTFLVWTPPGMTMSRQATLDEVDANQSQFPIWLAARNWLDSLLRMQLGTPYVQVTEVGTDIAHIVRNFDVGARYAITSTRTQNSMTPSERVQITESWRALVFQWQLGCPAGDMGCARRPIELSGMNANLAPASATYGAAISWSPRTTSPAQSERFHVALDPHRIDLRYGAIILLVLDQIVFPSLPGGLASNSLSGVIANIVQCRNVASAISNATGIPAVVIMGFCQGAVDAAAMAIENQVLSIDSANNPGIAGGLSPSGGGELYLVDRDHDLRTETVEDLTTYIAWTTAGGTTGPSTPVTGHGRRAASLCTHDADCASGLVCTPIPSYLEVRELENDCRRPVGGVAGAMPCTQNADCASNLCFASAGRNICYAACAGSGAACSMGTCTSGAAVVDLDSVMAGLGDATATACVP